MTDNESKKLMSILISTTIEGVAHVNGMRPTTIPQIPYYFDLPATSKAYLCGPEGLFHQPCHPIGLVDWEWMAGRPSTPDSKTWGLPSSDEQSNYLQPCLETWGKRPARVFYINFCLSTWKCCGNSINEDKTWDFPPQSAKPLSS